MKNDRDVTASIESGVIVDFGGGRSSAASGGKYNLTNMNLSEKDISRIAKIKGVSVTQAKGA